jgi:hypothetical protein
LRDPKHKHSKNIMSSIARRFILTAALTAACLLPGLTRANQGHHQSGIIGRVQVEQVGLPHLWKVRVSTEAYSLVEDIQTDENGQFVVNLKPGTYHLTPFLGGEEGAVLVGPSIQATVEKKDFTVVELPLVFGPM